MPTIRRVSEYRSEMRELLSVKASAETRNLVIGRMVDAIAASLTQGKKVLILSDNDGTMSPFCPKPMDSRVDPTVADAFRAYRRFAEEWVVTGGDVRRTTHVLEQSGLLVNAKCNYGAEELEWNGDVPELTFHPDTPFIEPFLEEVAEEVDRLLAARMGLPENEHALIADGDEAIAQGRYFLERKGIAVAFHPKGAGDQEAFLDQALEEAIPNCKTKWAEEAKQPSKGGPRDGFVEVAGENLHLHGNSGNRELSWNLGITKYSAVEELFDRVMPGVVIFSGDDKGDLPAIEKLHELADAGVATFNIGVINPPEPNESREGTPATILEACDVAVLSCAELGQLFGEVLRQAVCRYPTIAELSSAASQLPSRNFEAVRDL